MWYSISCRVGFTACDRAPLKYQLVGIPHSCLELDVSYIVSMVHRKLIKQYSIKQSISIGREASNRNLIYPITS